MSDIVYGLHNIHKEELAHRDFHSGNILNKQGSSLSYANISDLGLCKPASEKLEKHNKNVYRVLPYVAPEVLRVRKYTQASNIYGFGIMIYEVLPPYYDMAHEELLAIKICQEFRPKFDINVPRFIEDIFKQCVDAVAQLQKYLEKTFDQWYNDVNKISTQFDEIDDDEFKKKATFFLLILNLFIQHNLKLFIQVKFQTICLNQKMRII